MSNPAEGFLGALLVLSFISCILYGITVLQTFIYFQTYPNDAKILKFLVIWVFFLETSHTIFAIIVVYYFCIANFGNVRVWGPHWSLGAVTLFQVLIASTVETVYVRRIWFVSGHARLLTSALSFIVFLRFAVGLAGASSILAFAHWSTSRIRNLLLKQPQPIVTLTLSLGAFTDLSIVIVFSFYMLRGRRQYSRASRTLVNMLMLYAINTGAATAATSLSVAIVYASVRVTLASTGVAEIGAKLYANSFIGSLNSRAFLRHKNLNPAYSGFGASISDIEFTSSPSDSSATPRPGPSVVLAEYSGGTAHESDVVFEMPHAPLMRLELWFGSDTKRTQGERPDDVGLGGRANEGETAPVTPIPQAVRSSNGKHNVTFTT
ncbi:hypothetical protein V8D89_000070 [Ganoderma adspersum]